ncbi:hypothetical protein D918_03203 [Trichuris suis]|nr:hypothetical protein D918_03203 [Trichuris suis]
MNPEAAVFLVLTVCAMRRQGSHSVLALPIAHPRWIRFPDFQSEQRRSASLFIMASLNNPVSSGRLSPNSQREWIEEQFDSSDIISAKKDKNVIGDDELQIVGNYTPALRA